MPTTKSSPNPSQKVDFSSLADRYCGLPTKRETVHMVCLSHGEFQEQRRLFAREQGAMWERRLLPTTGACCEACAIYASAGWVPVSSSAGICAFSHHDDCRCQLVFAGDEAIFADGEGVSSETVCFDTDWTPYFDAAFFDWDESKRLRGPDGRFLPFAGYVGDTYKAMKAEREASGDSPPTKAELMARIRERMPHWSDDKFHTVLGKSIQKELISPDIHTQQATPGDTAATRALSQQIQGGIQQKQDPDVASKGLFGNLMKLSPEEVNYIHNRLGLTPPPAGDSKSQLAGNILFRARAAAGDSERANAAASEILALKKPDASPQQLENLSNLKAQLQGMSIHELGHLAGKLNLADGLPEKFQKNLTDAGASAGQMVLARNADNAADVRKLISGEIDKASAGLLQKQSAADNAAMDAQLAPTVQTLKQQLDDPNLNKEQETRAAVDALTDKECLHVAKKLGLPDDGEAGAKNGLHQALAVAVQGKVDEDTKLHVSVIQGMMKSGDYSNMQGVFGGVVYAPPQVQIAVATSLGLNTTNPQTGEKDAGKAIASLAGHLNEQRQKAETSESQYTVGFLSGAIDSPQGSVKNGAVLPSAQKKVDALLERASQLAPERVQEIAKALGLPSMIPGGSKAVIQTIIQSIRDKVKGAWDKEAGRQKLDTDTQTTVDCSKLIYWGKPAKECGNAENVVTSLRAAGVEQTLHAYSRLQKEIGLPDLKSTQPQAMADEAARNLSDSLKIKEAEKAAADTLSKNIAPAVADKLQKIQEQEQIGVDPNKRLARSIRLWAQDSTTPPEQIDQLAHSLGVATKQDKFQLASDLYQEIRRRLGHPGETWIENTGLLIKMELARDGTGMPVEPSQVQGLLSGNHDNEIDYLSRSLGVAKKGDSTDTQMDAIMQLAKKLHSESGKTAKSESLVDEIKAIQTSGKKPGVSDAADLMTRIAGLQNPELKYLRDALGVPATTYSFNPSAVRDSIRKLFQKSLGDQLAGDAESAKHVAKIAEFFSGEYQKQAEVVYAANQGMADLTKKKLSPEAHDEYFKLKKVVEEGTKTLQGMMEEHRQALYQLLKPSKAAVFATDVKKGTGKKPKEAADGAIEFFKNTFSVRASDPAVLSKVTVAANKTRANAKILGPNAAQITLHDGDVGTAVHELGHVIEFHHQGVKDLAREFRTLRGLDQEPPSLLKNKFPALGYKGNENGKKDNFDKHLGDTAAAYYCGKSYPDGSTEIISMGMENLYNDPAGFCARDPQYAQFIIGILRGNVR